MRNISAFAAQNPRIAQISITILLIIAGSGAFHGGIALFAIQGIQIPVFAFPVLIGLMYLTGRWYYSGEALKLHKSVYKKRLFVSSLFVCWLFCFVAGNRTASVGMQSVHEEQVISGSKGPVSLLMIEGTSNQKAQNWFKWFTTKKKAAVKKEVEFFTKKRLKAGEMDDFGKVMLALLAIVVYLGIAALVLSLSCSLSCNGQEAAAAIVLALGLGLSTWGLIAVLASIFRKRQNDEGGVMPNGEPIPRRGPSKKEKM